MKKSFLILFFGMWLVTAYEEKKGTIACSKEDTKIDSDTVMSYKYTVDKA